ncbi:MAG: hypothetical protein EZS28_016395 [Streblomastix strix]|uniref:Uncharacterized protein n=1 Tax=Streblomastix strix TaxID=222440 RepID=A0A5J4W0P3_9EUKA|nr:MAG: hypothetical protein EZS28_016395 [Streblomastix strix]
MVYSQVLNKETQWNMKKDSKCEQIEQGNRKTTLRNVGTRRCPISSQLNGLCHIIRPQISISSHHSISELNTIPSIKFQQQQLCIQSNAFWDQTQFNLLRRSSRINPQTSKNTFRNQNSKLLRRHTSNPVRQLNTQNINNGNNKNAGTIRMDIINREMRYKSEIDNISPRMDMEPEGNGYMNYREKKVENEVDIEGLVQRSMQEQKHKEKTTTSADRQIKFPKILDK